MVPGLIFKSLIHLEFILVYGVRKLSREENGTVYSYIYFWHSRLVHISKSFQVCNVSGMSQCQTPSHLSPSCSSPQTPQVRTSVMGINCFDLGLNHI